LENENILTIDGIPYDRLSFTEDQHILDGYISKLVTQRRELEQALKELELVINSLVKDLVNDLQNSSAEVLTPDTETSPVFNTAK
jgi:hypothetical protein